MIKAAVMGFGTIGSGVVDKDFFEQKGLPLPASMRN